MNKTILIALLFLISCSSSKKEKQDINIYNQSKESVSFLALGDQGTGGVVQKLISMKMNEICEDDDISFYILLGDNFYWDGVSDSKDKKFKDMFENIYDSKCIKSKEAYAVLGNHDYKQNPNAEIEYSKQNRDNSKWNMPNNYYTKSFGGTDKYPLLQIVFLDTNIELKEQIPFLIKTFKGSNAIWKAVAAHHPIRSFSKKYGDNKNLIRQLLPVLQELKIDLYLSGHAHNLQMIEKPNEPIYVISGTGGKGTRKISKTDDKSLIYHAEKYGFAKILMNKDTLQVKFYTLMQDTELSIYKKVIKINKSNL